MSTDAQQIVSKLWNYCNVLRDDGLSYGDYVEQLTFLLFLKMAHEQTQPPWRKPSIIPEGYDWPSLLARDGDDLETHYRHVLETLPKQGGMLRVIFQKAQNKIQDPAKLRRLIVDLIDKQQWRMINADVKGDAYEGLLEKNAQDTKGGAGQYFTPRPLIQAIVEVMRPRPGETICDPACGTGGFLLAAHDHIARHHPRLDRDQKRHLKLEALRGVEIVDGVTRLCAMNLLLHGVGPDADEAAPPVATDDSLRADPGDRCDLVLTNPPFGKKSSYLYVNDEGEQDRKDLTVVRDDFSATTSNKQLNFMQHVKTLLKVPGRAAVVVPDNVLFEGGAGEAIRRRLLQECDVHTLLRLPTGIFYAQGVKANVLFFDRKPASPEPWTRTVWVYDLRTNLHFTLKTNRLKRSDLDDFVACNRAENRHERQPTWSEATPEGRWRPYAYEELLRRDKVSLDLFWLRDESLEDAAGLEDPDAIAAEISRTSRRRSTSSSRSRPTWKARERGGARAGAPGRAAARHGVLGPARADAAGLGPPQGVAGRAGGGVPLLKGPRADAPRADDQAREDGGGPAAIRSWPLVARQARRVSSGGGLLGLQEAIDTSTSGGKLVFHVFGALAGFERDIIRGRTRAGLAAARARGPMGGRPRNLDDKKIPRSIDTGGIVMPVNRRSFLATSAALGAAAAAPGRAPARVAEAAPDDWIGRAKADLPTPALLVDLDALEANIAAMAAHVREHSRGHRPHAKTHKCAAIARLQVAAGALGNCAATVPEAEALAAAGIPGILLTSPILDPRKIARMARLAQDGSEVLLAVGHPRQLELLDEAAAAGRVTLDVLVDLDVGDRRTGIPPGPPALELARLADRCTHLRLRGIQAYSGSSSHVAGFDRRREASRAAMARAVATRALFERHGLEAGILSGGSTGTYNIDAEIEGVTELQVGSYVFMDVNYRKVGGRGGPVYDDFAPSLTVLTTVVGATHPDRVTLDAGIKAFSTDSGDLPESVDRPASWAYRRGGDEFGLLTAADGGTLPGIGDRLEFYVPHCDPTVNLYDRIHALRGGRVEAVWPVIARRETP